MTNGFSCHYGELYDIMIYFHQFPLCFGIYF